VFINVLGDIKPEQLALLGDRLHIDPLKKIARPSEKAEDTENPAKNEKTEK